MISSGSLPPFLLIILLGHLWPVAYALILPHHLRLLEIPMISRGPYNRAGKHHQSGAKKTWKEKSFGAMEHFRKSQLF